MGGKRSLCLLIGISAFLDDRPCLFHGCHRLRQPVLEIRDRKTRGSGDEGELVEQLREMLGFALDGLVEMRGYRDVLALIGGATAFPDAGDIGGTGALMVAQLTRLVVIFDCEATGVLGCRRVVNAVPVVGHAVGGFDRISWHCLAPVVKVDARGKRRAGKGSQGSFGSKVATVSVPLCCTHEQEIGFSRIRQRRSFRPIGTCARHRRNR